MSANVVPGDDVPAAPLCMRGKRTSVRHQLQREVQNLHFFL